MIISYQEMCKREGRKLRRGMYYRPNEKYSVILACSKNSQYEDIWLENGRVLIYQGHDAFRNPKKDQPYKTSSGRLTQNGFFFDAAKFFKEGKREAEIVKVYEKVTTGVWKDHGFFKLIDGWRERKGGRIIFRFRLEKLT